MRWCDEIGSKVSTNLVLNWYNRIAIESILSIHCNKFIKKCKIFFSSELSSKLNLPETEKDFKFNQFQDQVKKMF